MESRLETCHQGKEKKIGYWFISTTLAIQNGRENR